MNICLVSQNYPPDTAQGGISTQTWNKARALTDLGHTVHVLSCAAKAGPALKTTIDDGVTVHRMQPPGRDSANEFSVYNEQTYSLGYTWSVLRHLRGLLATSVFDVIDFADYGAEGFAFQIDRAPWEPAVVVQLHAPLAILAEHIGWPAKESDFYSVGTFMEGVSIEKADALMACSANIADFTAEFYSLPRESIEVVHCGVDIKAFYPADSNEPIERPTVLFVGNIAGNKGLTTVFDACSQLRSKYPDLRLQIVGSGDDELTERLKSRAQKEMPPGGVEFLGFVERSRLPDFYRRASVFASPAQYEGGVANVYLEAMASGCPVIASTAGGAPEAVVNGELGLLVPPLDVDATVTAIDRILSDALLRDRLGRAGRQRVEQYFAMDKYISRVLATYEKAIENLRKKLKSLDVEMESNETQVLSAKA